MLQCLLVLMEIIFNQDIFSINVFQFHRHLSFSDNGMESKGLDDLQSLQIHDIFYTEDKYKHHDVSSVILTELAMSLQKIN